MKIKLIIVPLAIALMSTKCAEKQINIIFENNSNQNIVLSSTKNRDSLKKIILENSYHNPCFKYLKSRKNQIDTLGESDLYFYSGMKEQDYCTFYFFKVVAFDTLVNNYIFEKKYDSINIDKEKILVGDKAINRFTYSNKKIIFRSKQKD